MKFLSRWTRKKEDFKKKEDRRQAAREKLEEAKKMAEGAKGADKEAAVAAAGALVSPEKKQSAGQNFLLKPLVTEKSTYMQSEGRYCFSVHPSSNKTEVKKAIEGIYGVKVLKVRVVNYQGKTKNYGRYRGRRKNWKKAIVSLPKGQKIEIHKNV